MTVLFLVSSATLLVFDRNLVTPEAPHGIVSFEFAGNAERSAAILGSWSPTAREAAFFIQGFDFLYLLVYPLWLALSLAGLAEVLGGVWHRLGHRVGWLALVAAPCDTVENIALVAQLWQGASEPWAQVAWGFALLKFGVVGLAALSLLLMVLTWSRRRVFQGSAGPVGGGDDP